MHDTANLKFLVLWYLKIQRHIIANTHNITYCDIRYIVHAP